MHSALGIEIQLLEGCGLAAIETCVVDPDAPLLAVVVSATAVLTAQTGFLVHPISVALSTDGRVVARSISRIASATCVASAAGWFL